MTRTADSLPGSCPPRGLRREAAWSPLHVAVQELAAKQTRPWAKLHLRTFERRSPSAKGTGFIYLVQVRGFDLVKIGYSIDPAKRLVDLENGSGMCGGLVPILRFRGAFAKERTLHARYAEQRLFGEWFIFSGEVAEWASEIILKGHERIEGSPA